MDYVYQMKGRKSGQGSLGGKCVISLWNLYTNTKYAMKYIKYCTISKTVMMTSILKGEIGIWYWKS
jgi:hypothetical protein